MSLESWKKEFYDSPACSSVTVAEAIVLSIKKWIGLRRDNLIKHSVHTCGYKILDNLSTREFSISAESCWLCYKFHNRSPVSVCHGCPLDEILGHPCDSSAYSPYNIFVGSGDPEPMIKALEDALEEHHNSPFRDFREPS